MKSLSFFKPHTFCASLLTPIMKLSGLLFFFVLVFGLQAHATHTWTGAVNNDWNNAGNWNPASIPSGADFVVIPNVATDPEIKTGAVAGIIGLEIKDEATLKINQNAQLHIDGSTGNAIENNGRIYNFGLIRIGFMASISGHGIENNGTLTNSQLGHILIDGCTGSGIVCDYNSEVANFGHIMIGTFFAVGIAGIASYLSEFSNYENAVVSIDRTQYYGFLNGEYSEVRNFGKMIIGSKASVGTYGIGNTGKFNNYDTGDILINRSVSRGIINDSEEPFSNSGKIQIGSASNSGEYGIENKSLFTNFNGEIIIDRVKYGIGNATGGTFNNSAIIKLGPNSGIADIGITSGGAFTNFSGGLITIDRVSGYGIETNGGDDGSFTNAGNITIGAAAPLFLCGIFNAVDFNNTESGEIHIDHFTHAGIQQNKNSGAIFDNEGKIYIGQNPGAGKYGIINQAAFVNQIYGAMYIDRTSVVGLGNYDNSASFENKGHLIIGATASTGTYGVNNSDDAIYHNKPGGLLTVNRAIDIGFFNEGGAVINEEAIIIEGSSGNYSIKNTGDIKNELCSKISVQDAVWNEGTWTNVGLLSSVTTAAHTNIAGGGNFFVNHGVIEYPLGSPIPNVTNHDLIALPVSSNCNSITPALNLGNQLNFTTETTWYANEILSIPAGTYNQATNTFIATIVTPKLYFRVYDDLNNCQYVVAMKATYQMDLVPPTVICKNATAELNAAGMATITPAMVFQSGTDNCGVVAPSSVSPASFQCAHMGLRNVTLTVNDGNGNNATCVATVNVVDKLGPVLICKPFTANLNTAGTASIIPANVYQSGTDNCGIINIQYVLPNNFTCANLGNQLVTLTANDGYGNLGTCQATVTVSDKIAPTMLCRPATIYLNAAGQASLTAAQVNNGSFDNCGITVLSIDKASFNCSNIGANTVALGGMDQSSNRGQCSATVTVVDPIKPVALCKNITANLNASGALTLAGESINNGSSDNCSFSLSVTPSTFNCGNIGLNTVILKATDNGGNTATCSATVNLKDVTAPLALCKNTQIFLNDVGQATLSAAQINNGSSDACGIATMTISKTNFNCSDLPGSAQNVILTLKDFSNNTSTCIAQVTTKDNLAPTAICENTSVQLGSNGTVTVYSANLAADSYDNCSVWSYSPVAKVYTSANLGNNNLNITAKDWSNNGSTCVSVVQVLPYNGLGNMDDRQGNTAQLEESVALKVFPNPSAGEGILNFELPKAQDFTVILFDLSGKILWSQQGSGAEGQNTLSINASNLPASVYFIDFQSESLKKQTRWVIQN